MVGPNDANVLSQICSHTMMAIKLEIQMNINPIQLMRTSLGCGMVERIGTFARLNLPRPHLPNAQPSQVTK